MDKLKIALFGFESYISQIQRYREAFADLGHDLSFENPNIIYANDPSGFKKSLELKNNFKDAFLILHILDIPWHYHEIDSWIKLVVNQLNKADVIAANSEKVKKDLSKFIPAEKILVTYDVAKDVHLDSSIKKDNMFLFVGRPFDPVKRFVLVKKSILKISDGQKKIKICGPKDPGFGNYQGIVKDEELNKLYNSSKYVLLPSIAEGIGLPMIEGMICGAIPITCSDNLTAKEFSPPDFICEPNPQSIVNKIEELEKNYEIKRKIALEYGEKYKIQFNKKTIVSNILEIYKKYKEFI